MFYKKYYHKCLKEKVFALLRDKFDILDGNGNSAYWVVGKVTGLGFTIEDGKGKEIKIQAVRQISARVLSVTLK